jgi:flavin-binding protein dodecin
MQEGLGRSRKGSPRRDDSGGTDGGYGRTSPEISAKSDTSFEDAINVAVSRASEILRGVTAAWVKEQNVDIEDGRIVAWKVDLLVTFVLE